MAEPRINRRASMLQIMRELRLVRSCLDAQADKVDFAIRDLVFIAGLASSGGGVPLEPSAEPVAYNLRAFERTDGKVDFVIDGGKMFTLAPQPAEVFQFLASGEKDRGGKDVLVGWRSKSEVLKLLEASGGKSVRPSYVNNIMTRLRKALRAAGYDRGLIQSHRQKGYRLAFKSGTNPLP
jgi:hypothetical protein